jgi:SAM-dependent methyltransferase
MLWRLRQSLKKRFGVTGKQWARIVMDRELESFVSTLDIASLSALEISGMKWAGFGFKEYRSVSYAEYDVCGGPYEDHHFDVIIAEQVLEHVLWPYRAVKNVNEMLRPGGVFVVSTPFMLRVHNCPIDCSRWTELGMKYLLAEGGFRLDRIQTGSWGNRKCVISNFRRWTNWTTWLHSLDNEPAFPVVVWAMARKD